MQEGDGAVEIVWDKFWRIPVPHAGRKPRTLLIRK